MTHDPTIIALTGALLTIGALRGAIPPYREHRAIRRGQRAHRRQLWVTLRERGYDVTPWTVARKTGQLLEPNEWNQLRAQLDEQDREAQHHGT